MNWNQVTDPEAFLEDSSPVLHVGHPASESVALERAQKVATLTGKPTQAYIQLGNGEWELVGGFVPT